MRKVRFLRAFLFAQEIRPVCRSSGVGRRASDRRDRGKQRGNARQRRMTKQSIKKCYKILQKTSKNAKIFILVFLLMYE